MVETLFDRLIEESFFMRKSLFEYLLNVFQYLFRKMLVTVAQYPLCAVNAH